MPPSNSNSNNAKHTLLEFLFIGYLPVIVYFVAAAVFYDRLQGSIVPDFLLFPCGRLDPVTGKALTANSNNNNNNSTSASSATADPFFLNVPRSEPAAANVNYYAYLVTPFTLFVYWTASFVCLIVDLYLDRVGKWGQSKIHYAGSRNPQRIDHSLLRKAIRLSAMNSVVSVIAINGGLQYIIRRVPLLWHNACSAANSDLPLQLIALKMICVFLFSDVVFFATHYLTHHRLLYGPIHKLHHTFVEQVFGVCAAACHPLEHIFVNCFTVHSALLMFALPNWIAVIWSGLTALNTVLSHSGFSAVGAFHDNASHDAHHRWAHPAVEFGTSTFMDPMFRTTKEDRMKIKR